MITHKQFFEEVWYSEGGLDWQSGWDKARARMDEWINQRPDIDIINVETIERPITGSSIAQQRRSCGGVGYSVIYEERSR